MDLDTIMESEGITESGKYPYPETLTELENEASPSDRFRMSILHESIQICDLDIPKPARLFSERNWDTATYVTAYSTTSGNTFHTAGPGADQDIDMNCQRLKESDPYAKILLSRCLWPVDATIEQDWSGRGQHTVFQKSEHKTVNEILEVRDTLGITNTAKVESVKCRRILLARKTMLCRGTLDKEQAIAEVAHLSALEHAHILRVIGTYVMGHQLSILLYPVAEWNLDDFLKSIRSDASDGLYPREKISACRWFYGCLCDATSYIHATMTKHMDIKPQNILVRQNRETLQYPGRHKNGSLYTVFIADFGIARSYSRPEDILTDGCTAFTRKYAAPEVVKQDFRALPADIFSLGCVFLEMMTNTNFTYDVYHHLESPRWRSRWSNLRHVLATNIRGDDSYQANIHELQDFCKGFWAYPAIASIINRMIRHNPKKRPTAAELSIKVPGHSCCKGGPCQLEAFQEDEEEKEEKEEEEEEEEEEEASDSDMHVDIFSMHDAV